MAKSKAKWLWLSAATVFALGVGYWLSHRYQVFVVKTLGGYAGTSYVRGPSKWFATKTAAMTFAASQMGGVDFAGAFVADSVGGVHEVFHGHFLTGEEIDAIIVRAEHAGLRLDNAGAA